MTDLVVTTFDWVPDTPPGYVRDLRVRWALEEAGLPYREGAWRVPTANFMIQFCLQSLAAFDRSSRWGA